MSTLWTPGGERPIRREPEPPPASGPTGTREPTEQELAGHHVEFHRHAPVDGPAPTGDLGAVKRISDPVRVDDRAETGVFIERLDGAPHRFSGRSWRWAARGYRWRRGPSGPG